MAVVVNQEKFSLGNDGRLRLSVQYLTDTRIEALREIPFLREGLARTSASGSPFISESDGRYLVDAVYEGLIDDPDPETDQYEISSEYREQKIETFPDREILRSEWGASEEDGRLVFTPTIKRPSEGGTGLGPQKTEEIPNPFYNLTTYPVEYIVATMTILRKRVPAELERTVGTVVDRLPSGFEYEGNAKSFLLRPLQRAKVGGAWRIRAQYQQVDEFKDVQALLVLLQKSRSGSSGVGSGLGSTFGSFRFTQGLA